MGIWYNIQMARNWVWDQGLGLEGHGKGHGPNWSASRPRPQPRGLQLWLVDVDAAAECDVVWLLSAVLWAAASRLGRRCRPRRRWCWPRLWHSLTNKLPRCQQYIVTWTRGDRLLRCCAWRWHATFTRSSASLVIFHQPRSWQPTISR